MSASASQSGSSGSRWVLAYLMTLLIVPTGVLEVGLSPILWNTDWVAGPDYVVRPLDGNLDLDGQGVAPNLRRGRRTRAAVLL